MWMHMFARCVRKGISVLIDTDVLIWYLRGNKNAYRVIDAQEGFEISAVTYMELVQGMRDKNELQKMRKALSELGVTVLAITESITSRAMVIVEENYLSSPVELADALIASTAIEHGLDLLTGNVKHYKKIKNLSLKNFRPK